MPVIRGFPSTWQEKVRCGPWRLDQVGNFRCPLCQGQSVTKAPMVIASDRTEKATMQRFQICDDCRRKLCTCDTCTAFQQDEDDPSRGFCGLQFDSIHEPVKIRAVSWCREDYRQGRPLTISEVELRLGKKEQNSDSSSDDAAS